MVITWHGNKGSTVQDSFNYCSELLKGELHIRDDMSEMDLHALYCGFPQATEIRSTLGDKLPGDTLC